MWRHGIHTVTEPSMYITATANTSGIAQGFLGPAAAGYCWYVERWTSWSNSAGTPKLELFAQSTNQVPTGLTATAGDRGGRQDFTPTAVNDVGDEVNPIYIPSGYYLVAFWSGATSGDLFTLSTQIAVHLLDLSREPRQLEVQQTEPTPDINVPGVTKADALIDKAERLTQETFNQVQHWVDKVI